MLNHSYVLCQSEEIGLILNIQKWFSAQGVKCRIEIIEIEIELCLRSLLPDLPQYFSFFVFLSPSLPPFLALFFVPGKDVPWGTGTQYFPYVSSLRTFSSEWGLKLE